MVDAETLINDTHGGRRNPWWLKMWYFLNKLVSFFSLYFQSQQPSSVSSDNEAGHQGELPSNPSFVPDSDSRLEHRQDWTRMILTCSFPASIALLSIYYQIQPHTIPFSLHFLSLCTLLAFSVSLFSSFFRTKGTIAAKVLEKTGVIAAGNGGNNGNGYNNTVKRNVTGDDNQLTSEKSSNQLGHNDTTDNVNFNLSASPVVQERAMFTQCNIHYIKSNNELGHNDTTDNVKPSSAFSASLFSSSFPTKGTIAAKVLEKTRVIAAGNGGNNGNGYNNTAKRNVIGTGNQLTSEKSNNQLGHNDTTNNVNFNLRASSVVQENVVFTQCNIYYDTTDNVKPSSAFSASLFSSSFHTKCTIAAKVLEKIGVMFVVLTVFVAIEITLPWSLKWVAWLMGCLSLLLFVWLHEI